MRCFGRKSDAFRPSRLSSRSKLWNRHYPRARGSKQKRPNVVAWRSSSIDMERSSAGLDVWLEGVAHNPPGAVDVTVGPLLRRMLLGLALRFLSYPLLHVH